MVNGILYWDVLRLFYEMKLGLLKAMQNVKMMICPVLALDTWGVDFDCSMLKVHCYQILYIIEMRTENMIEEACKIVPQKRNI